MANSLVSVFDGTALLGTTAADGTGAWTFAVGFDNIDSFTAVATDAAGNISPVSLPFNVVGNAQEAKTRQELFALAMMPSLGSTPSLAVADTADHIINAAESTAVDFTVSGLAAGATGAVTFSDASKHQVVVNVDGNGAFSANLSGLTDGAITSSLSVADPNGLSKAVAGNTVSLDTDSGLDPSLSVNAADPSNVTFTVSGLESDYSGTVTFTDASGKSDVVPIGANGTYSANLSNLQSGTVTYLMTVSDPAGNVINVDPTITLGDGSANAPAGAAQLPSLLSGYATRPSWMVAGVDYAVGYGSTSLTDWESLSGPGISVNLTTHVVTVTNVSGAVISGVDFSLHGGATLYFANSPNATVTDCNFGGTNLTTISNAVIYADSNSGGLTVTNSVIDGAGAGSGSTLVSAAGGGTVTLEYDWFKNFPQHVLELEQSSGKSFSVVYKYNLIEQGAESPGAHLNYLQFNSGTATSVDVEYNTSYQSPQASSGEGYQFYDNSSGGSINNVTLAYNTMIATGGAAGSAMSYVVHGGTVTSATVHDNYFAVPAAYGAFYSSTLSGWSVANNVDMTTGKLIQSSNSELSPTTVTQVVSSLSSGIELPGTTITLTVKLSSTVTVSGTPTLSLNDGGTATYTGGSGTNALTFSYTVSSSDATTSALAITQFNLPSGAKVTDSNGNTPNFSGAAVTFTGLQIDPPTGPSPISLVETPSIGDLNAGNIVTLTLNMSSAVTVSGGTPTLALNDGGTATYTGGSGTSALTFSYTVGAGDMNVSALSATAVNLNGATIKDGSGNAASFSLSGITQTGPQIDTTTPSVSSVAASGTGITSGSGDLGVGSAVTLTLKMSEAVTVSGGIPTLTLNDGGTATYTGGSGTNALTFSYTVVAGQSTSDLAVTAVNLNSATVQNGAGTVASLTGAVTNPSGTLQIDTTTPTLDSITESPANGHLKAGKKVTLTLNMSEAVTVTGTPTLTLNDGAVATYTGGSGTNALTFSYTVAAGQNVNSLAATAINLNGATVKNGAGTTASFGTLSGLTQVGAQIDTMTPLVTQVVASPGSGIENPGDVVTLTLSMSEAVTVTGTPTLTLNDGGIATYTGGSGTNALTFSYTVGAKDSTVPTLAVTQVNLPSGATVADAAGNAADLSGAVTTFPGLSIDPPPVVVSVSETPSSGDLGVGKTVTLTLTLNDVVTVAGGTPSLSLNDGGVAIYTGGSGTNTLTFRYTVGAGDNTTSLAATGLTLNGATIQNSLGNQAIFSFNGVTQTGPQIDTTSPSVTAVAASGSGITAGSGDLPSGSVVTLTVDLSEVVTVAGGTPTLTLNDGGTATYSGGSGTNALTFSYTVAAGQNTSDLAVTAFNQGTATITNGAGTAANMSGVTASISGTLQIDTSTHIAQVGSDYFLDNANNSGPELRYAGAAVTVGEFGSSWDPISAVQFASGGYDVAWKNTATGQYEIWALNSNGNYLSSPGGIVSGTSTTLESYETVFNQDLNGDGAIGTPPPTLIKQDGSTSLYQAGNTFEVEVSGTGPTIKYGSAAVTVGEFGSAWAPIGAVQLTGGGYDVAWKNTATGQYEIWALNSNGNYLSNPGGIMSGTSTTLESYETVFNQDLNGDGSIGPPPPTLIKQDGSTSLYQAGNTFEVEVGGTGPTIKYGGAAVTVGEFGSAWAPIGAVQITGGGYDVAWKNTATGQYEIWALNSNGNYLSNPGGILSGTSPTLESYETVFNQDLNGDGTIGLPPPTLIKTDGSTSLYQAGNTFEVEVGGTGPTIKYGGAAVTVGEFGSAWAPIGAVQISGGGYDVAWKNTATGQYEIWALDSNGNYLSSPGGIMSGTSTTLESYENTFQQDLNGDGVIGIYAAPGTTLQIASALSGPSGSATIGAGATLELAAANSSSVTFASSTGMLELDHSATFDGVIFGFTGNGTLTGSDQIDLKGINFNNVHDSYSNGVLTVTDGTNSAALDFNGSYVLANFEFASDGKGGTILFDPPVTAAQGGVAQSHTAPDETAGALNQQVALFAQQIAAAFPSSALNGSGSPMANLSSAQLAQIAAPVAVTQQHV